MKEHREVRGVCREMEESRAAKEKVLMSQEDRGTTKRRECAEDWTGETLSADVMAVSPEGISKKWTCVIDEAGQSAGGCVAIVAQAGGKKWLLLLGDPQHWSRPTKKGSIGWGAKNWHGTSLDGRRKTISAGEDGDSTDGDWRLHPRGADYLLRNLFRR